MAIGLQVWSQTPNSNATSDTNINWAEGMAPSAVNDSARSMMASAAKWRDDNNGTIVTSGTTLAYTAVTNQVEGALTAGYTVSLMFHATNDSSATLAVDGLTAKPLQMYAGKNVGLSALPLGSIQRFTYSTTGTGQWIANNANKIEPVTAGLTAGGVNITSAAFVMCGLGGTFTFTPLTSSRCFVCITAYGSIDIVGSGQVKLFYGTGTAPVTGAAATGTAVPGTGVIGWTSAGVNYALPITALGVITGLTPGTAYWVDFQCLRSGGTATLNIPTFTAFEL